LAALLKVSALAAKKQLKSDDMAFELAPRLNAAGRLGQPQLAVELLITDREERATELAQSIDNLNRSRQKLERSILLAASKQIKEQFDLAVEPALVLAERGWHPGVIGIVAGRLASKHHRPVVMVSWDQMGTRSGIGSARSVPGVNLYAALTACSEFLLAHGGHAAAAGLRIAEEQLAGFRAAFCEVVAASLGGCPGKGKLWIDAEVPLAALTLDTVRQIDQLAPFGEGNPHPVLCTSGVTLAGPPRLMGENGQHLALRLVQHGVAMRAVAFSNGEWCEDLATVSEPIDVAFYPVINHYRGRQSVELRLVDWRRGFGTSSTLSSSR
jgi:single-stranded-DNA-specific exonuclease